MVEQVAGEFAGKVKVVQAKVQEAFGAASELGIMSIPTLVFYKQGQEVGRAVGWMSHDKLVAEVKKKLGV